MQSRATGEEGLAPGEQLVFREAVPADEPVAHEAFSHLSEETRHNRFLASVNEIPASILHGLRHPDPSRQLIIAVMRRDSSGREVEPVGAGRLVHDDGAGSCDFGLILTDAWQGRGVGTRLLGMLVDHARARGLRMIRGDVLAINERMLRLAKKLGFDIEDHPAEGRRVKVVAKRLRADT